MRTIVIAVLMGACCYAGIPTATGTTEHPQIAYNGTKPSTTTLTADRSTVYYGEYIVFMATVTGLKATPSGTVDFREGSTSIGSATLVSGVATLNINSLNAGAHIITAYYSGDPIFLTSSSSAYGVIVNPDLLAISLSDSKSTSTFSEPVTISATVSVLPPGAGKPSGSLYLDFEGAVVFPELNASGKASDSTTLQFFHPGAVTYNATYPLPGLPDPNFTQTTSPTYTHTINKASTTMSITPSINPATLGVTENVTVTVNSVPPATAAPTGSVVFDDGISGPATIDLVQTGPTSSGFTRVRTNGWPVGSYVLKMTYAGDRDFNGADSVQTTLTVNKAPTTIALASSANPASTGQSITFTATVTATTNSSLSVPLSGSTPITFKDGSSTLGTATLSNKTATFTTTALSSGTHSITAVFDGDSSFLGSTSPALSQTVNSNLSPTTTTLTSSVNPSTAGQSVKFTAAVASSGSGTPSGTVTFNDGAAALGVSSLIQGKASFTMSSLSTGEHTITASYAGDSDFAGSSDSLMQTVNGNSSRSTATSLTATPNPVSAGQPVTLNATVTSVAGGAQATSASQATSMPTGSVTFKDGAAVLSASTLIQGVASYTTSELPAGGHSITAEYSGDSAFDGSTSNMLNLTVTAGSQTGGVVALPHFAAGDTWTTGILVVNTGNLAAQFSIAFFDDGGSQATLPFSDGPKSILTATLPANGSAYYEASDPRGALISGWAQVTSDPSIVVQALFRNDAAGTYYEAAVQSNPGSREFLIPFDATTFAANGAPFYTGFAIANTENSLATVVCIARDADGTLILNAVAVPALSPYGHWANYLFPALAGKRGVIDCSSNTRIAATALRVIGTSAFSSLPVLNDPATFADAPNRALSHIAAGDTWTTGFFVLNTGNSAAQFSMSFHGDGGDPVSLPFAGGPASALSGTLPAHGSSYYEAADPLAPLAAGWAQITADASIVVQALFRNNAHGTYYEAAVPSSSGSREFLFPFDATTFPANGQPFFTGFAIANLEGNTANIACTARDPNGVVIPNGVPVPSLSPYGHWANYLFPALSGRRGTVDCISSTNVAATALRAIGNNAFSSLPVITK